MKLNYKFLIFAGIITLYGLISYGFWEDGILLLIQLELIIAFFSAIIGFLGLLFGSNSRWINNGALCFSGSLCALLNFENCGGTQIVDFNTVFHLILGGLLNLSGIFAAFYKKISK